MVSAKRSPALQLALDRDGVGPVDVVIELAVPPGDGSGTTRQARIAARKEAFEATAEPVRSAISAVGGAVKGSLWINNVVYATIPASGVPLLEKLADVHALDAPGKVLFD